MEPEQSAPLEYLLGHLTTGIAILDGATLRIRYVNSYLLSLLDEPWRARGVNGEALQDIVAPDLFPVIEPPLREAFASGKTLRFSEIPYEGALETRGRTYWNVTIEPKEARLLGVFAQPDSPAQQERLLSIAIEDVTERVRSRMHIDAIHYISSAIAGPFSLPHVLDRVLDAVQELVGSTRCAILLIDDSITGTELRRARSFARRPAAREQAGAEPPRVNIAAQKGLHPVSVSWHPQVGNHLLLGMVMQSRRSLIISDTGQRPEIELPQIDKQGIPFRPGSALCVPIFDPLPAQGADDSTDVENAAILGTIEVYHRRARGFPAEEVALLEQFAQQVGLAIQNARFFLRIDRLAKEAGRELRQREFVMQAIPDGVILYDARWHIVEANSAIRALLGWTDEVIGLHISEALARSKATYFESAPTIEEMVAQLESHAQGKTVDELKLTGADGRQYTMRRSKAPIQDEHGNIFAYIVVYHDVTEQAAAREQIEAQVIARTHELAQRNQALEEARAALEEEHARLEVLLEQLPSGVLLVSASDHRIIISNRQATQLLRPSGGTRDRRDSDWDGEGEQITGMNVDDLLRDAEIYTASGTALPYEQQPLYLALKSGETSEAELHITQSDGQSLFLLVNAAPLRAADGTIITAIVVLQNITHIKMLERAREDFFTTMAHELKTPLANIRAHLSALQAKDYQWSTDEQMRFLRTADEQVERLSSMINQFLDASRVEAGALRLELEPVLVPELFEDVQERLEALITSSGRALSVEIEPDVTAVFADYELIINVLTNLLSNAFRYAPEGDIVRLQAEAVYNNGEVRPSGVEIRVIDRGSGITPERQAELFTRFSTFAAQRRPAADRPGQPAEQRRGSARWSPASGLGLYISRGIIEAHGSRLQLHSTPGQGTTFAFVLGVASLVKNEV